ncbi:MAG: ZPR1 zinc finger domain-containing protein [Nanoarchaeota archaeon]|nr:ZPR1 zinc finger domain-containing protein [Nanoarchaeota archaeon]
MDKLEGETCPMCGEKKLTLIEDEQDLPYFGKTFLFSMSCSACGFNKSDVEAAERKEPCRITFETKTVKDMNVRVVKSSEATVKVIPFKMEMTPGPASIGFISNVEGILDKFEKIVQSEKNADEDDDKVKTACKNLLKKIWKAKCGDIPVKIVIEDPSGNSAIISENAVVEPLKASKGKKAKK